MFSKLRTDQIAFLVLFHCFLLFSVNVVQAAPLRVRQTITSQSSSQSQSTQVTTVHTTMTPMGLVTETCVVVFNPVKDAQGKDVIQEVKTCTLTVGGDPNAPPPAGKSSTSIGATGAPPAATYTSAVSSPTDTLISASSTLPQLPPMITTAVTTMGLPPPATSIVTSSAYSASTASSASATISTDIAASATLSTDSASPTVAGTDTAATGAPSPPATGGAIVVIGTSSIAATDTAAPTPTPTASSTDSAAGAPSNTATTSASSDSSATGGAIVVVGTSTASPANPTDFPGGVAPTNGAGATGTTNGPSAATSAAADTAATGTSAASSGSAAAQETPTAAAAFTLPGKQLSVLPIGLGVFAGISVIALIVVGLVTYERTKYRKAFRQRKLAEAGAPMGYGGGNMA